MTWRESSPGNSRPCSSRHIRQDRHTEFAPLATDHSDTVVSADTLYLSLHGERCGALRRQKLPICLTGWFVMALPKVCLC